MIIKVESARPSLASRSDCRPARTRLARGPHRPPPHTSDRPATTPAWAATPTEGCGQPFGFALARDRRGLRIVEAEFQQHDGRDLGEGGPALPGLRLLERAVTCGGLIRLNCVPSRAQAASVARRRSDARAAARKAATRTAQGRQRSPTAAAAAVRTRNCRRAARGTTGTAGQPTSRLMAARCETSGRAATA